MRYRQQYRPIDGLYSGIKDLSHAAAAFPRPVYCVLNDVPRCSADGLTDPSDAPVRSECDRLYSRGGGVSDLSIAVAA